MMTIRKWFVFVILFSFTITGCGVLRPEPTPTPTETPVPTSTPEPTSTPTITLTPTSTATITPTFTPTPLSVEDVRSKNYIETKEISGLEIELVRFLIADKEILLQGHPQVKDDQIQPDDFDVPVFMDKPVVGEMVFRMTNNSDYIYTLFFSEVTVQAAGTQILLEDYILADAYVSKSANPYNPDILPGSTIYMSYWFGVEDKDVPELTEINILLESPYRQLSDGSYFGTGQYYYYRLDLTEWGVEPMLEEIKDKLY